MLASCNDLTNLAGHKCSSFLRKQTCVRVICKLKFRGELRFWFAGRKPRQRLTVRLRDLWRTRAVPCCDSGPLVAHGLLRNHKETEFLTRRQSADFLAVLVAQLDFKTRNHNGTSGAYADVLPIGKLLQYPSGPGSPTTDRCLFSTPYRERIGSGRGQEQHRSGRISAGRRPDQSKTPCLPGKLPASSCWRRRSAADGLFAAQLLAGSATP